MKSLFAVLMVIVVCVYPIRAQEECLGDTDIVNLRDLRTNLNTDTFGCVVLYCTGSNALDPVVPVKPIWYDDILDSSYDNWSNIYNYISEVSFGNVEMVADAYPSEA